MKRNMIAIAVHAALAALGAPFAGERIWTGPGKHQRGGFPGQVNVQPAPAVAGDFASTNPRQTVDAGPGALVTGALGATIGRFAWADANGIVTSYGAGAPTGFVHREQQALITTYLAESTMTINAGFEVTLFQGGDFWVKNDGASAATIGQKAYADNATGKITFGATGTPPAGGTSSASTISVNQAVGSVQLAINAISAGSIAGTTLTVGSIGSGTVLAAGQFIGGGNSTVGYIDPATYIVKQLTGTAGSTGTYQVSVSQNILSVAMTVTGGGATVTGTVTGTLAVGQTVNGTGLTTGTKIAARGTGTGGTGTYALDTAPTTQAGVTMTANGGTLTVGGTVTGTFSVGNVIHGASVTSGNTITAGLTGVGGAGTYLVSVGDTVGSEEIDVYSGTETKWICSQGGAAGELVKMSSYALG